MANSYKNIVITPNIGSSSDDPKIIFSGANTSVNTDITLKVYPTSGGTLSFEGGTGQLFSISNTMTGTIYSVNDISGIPSIEVIDTGLVKLAQYSGNVAIGKATANSKVEIQGDITATSFNGGQLAGMRNRIINGDMRIDQRNAGVARTGITNVVAFVTDRFYFQNSSGATVTVQQSSVAPTGFSNSFYCNVTTAGTPSYGFIQQSIEGFHFADLAQGTSSASPFTISFWVRSSVTGIYSVSVQTSTYDYSYNATYTINSANTWEYKSVTIPGTALGTWYTDNRQGPAIRFSLTTGAGGTPNTWVSGSQNGSTNQVNWFATNGATFYITGVQLEKGTVATPFEFRPYSIELSLCQRYYEISNGLAQVTAGATGFSTNTYWSAIQFAVTKRSTPTMIFYDTNSTVNQITMWKNATSYVGSSLISEVLTTSSFGLRSSNASITDCGLGRFYWVASSEI